MAPLLAGPLEWIGENLQFVVPVVLFILFSFLSRQKEEDDVAPPPPRPRRIFGEDDGSSEDLAAEQRAEQIREEIRRRIHERMGGAPEQPLPPELVELDETPAPPPLPVYRQPAPPPIVRQSAPAVSTQTAELAALDSGQASEGIAEQFRRLEAARQLANETAMRVRIGAYDLDRNPHDDVARARGQSDSARGRVTSGGLRNELFDRDGARRAIVLQEVLGKPIALRAPGGQSF